MPVDKDRIKALAERINKTSNADFVKRLLDRKRETIKNPDGTVSTHELGYVTEGDHAVVFPDIQSTDSGLVRFPYPESYERAVERGDTVHMSVPDAKLFTENYKDYYPGFNDYASGGNTDKDEYEDSIEPAIITASPETLRGKYKMYKNAYREAKKKHRQIRRDIKNYVSEKGFISSDEEAQPFIDRIDALQHSRQLLDNRQKAKDLWYSNLWDEPNNIISQLYRYYSRHHGYQKKHSRHSNENFGYGPGTDVIDLGKNVIRLTPDSKQSTALFNEFVESKYPTVLPASEYKENPDRILGDMAKFPASNISIYGGIRDGAFVLDSLKNFSDNTTIIPARNIKSGTPRITKINVPERDDSYGYYGYDSSYDWDKIEDNHILWSNSLDDPSNNLIAHYNEPSVQEGILRDVEAKANANKYLQDKVDSGRAGKYDRSVIRQNNRDIKKLQKIAQGKFPVNKFTLSRLATESNIVRSLPEIDFKVLNLGRYMPKERINSGGYTYVDDAGEIHPISDWNAGILDGKTILGNQEGGVFVGRIQDISKPQLDSLNNYLEQNPSWILRPDLGSFDQYRLDNPSLQTYLRQYFEHPRPEDPNVYTIGTTEPNKLWSHADGGPRRRTSIEGGEGHNGGGESGERHLDPRKWFANSENKWERVGNNRYWMANDSLVRSGSSPEDADRLARILAAQSALEAGWNDDVKGNNFAGYMSNGKRMSFDSPDEFWDYHIRNLDEKWPGWRRADSVKAYYDIVNNTALGLDTKEKFDAYNRAHRDSPAYIYAPAWENSNYLANLSGVYDRYINKYVPAFGNALSDGGDIHIKKSKRGTFTAAAKAHGKSVQAFASQVLANKDNYSPAMVKKANFARNAAKWHSDGGAINKAFDEGNLDVLRAAVNNVLSRKISGK